MHGYDVRPRKDKRGVGSNFQVLPFDRSWYSGSKQLASAIGYATHDSRSADAVIRVYDSAGKEIASAGASDAFAGFTKLSA
jgi:hypothetical protein